MTPTRLASPTDLPLSGGGEEAGDTARLAEIVERLQAASRTEGPRLVEGWLDRLDASGRWALIKLVTGGLRIGVSARLAKTALAELAKNQVNEIEEVWNGLEAALRDLFAWAEGRGPAPESKVEPPFHPLMLAKPIAEEDLMLDHAGDLLGRMEMGRNQGAAGDEDGDGGLYARTGDDISVTLPGHRRRALRRGGARRRAAGRTCRFGRLRCAQLRRPATTAQPQDGDAQLLASHPAYLRVYDCLVDGGEDIRALTFRERRRRLERAFARSLSGRMDLSPLLAYADVQGLAALRAAPPEAVIEGVMLKRWDSTYEPGRPKGLWFKWKRDPRSADAILMYAQRGHGKRSSYYSDYTFGVWRSGAAGRNLSADGQGLFRIHRCRAQRARPVVRNNTVRPLRAGPRGGAAGKELVFEVAFEGSATLEPAKSGVALRFPRIKPHPLG